MMNPAFAAIGPASSAAASKPRILAFMSIPSCQARRHFAQHDGVASNLRTRALDLQTDQAITQLGSGDWGKKRRGV
jgi:hypothetical protein